MEFILANLRRYCERRQSRSSSSSTLAHDASSAVHRLCGTLEQLKGEYDSVSEIVARHITTKQGGSRQHLKNLRGKVDLVLSGKLKSSFKNLERYKSQLSINLLILGKVEDLSDCACILVANNLSFNDLALGDKLDGLHDSVASLDENTEARLTSIDSSLRALGSADYPSRHKNQIAWEKEANINSISTDAPLQVIDSLMAQLMDMRHSIQTRPWGCNGEHLQNAALPLMLFKPKIQEALSQLTIQKHGQNGLSVKDANWIRAELEDLLATSHEKAAAAMRYPVTAEKSKLHQEIPGIGKSTYAAMGSYEQGKRQAVIHQRKIHHFLEQESSLGKVSIRLQWQKDRSGHCKKISDVLLLFAPRRDITENGLLVSLSRLHTELTEPRITRHISSYVVLDSSSPVFACVRHNDIDQLRGLLKSRKVTPTVRNTENESILSVSPNSTQNLQSTDGEQYAARHLRAGICDLLLNEGADPVNCRWSVAS